MSPFRQNRGVSLIEALVALAVMAIGLLGVVGMQAALRGSGDLSKQRSEAVRLAQQEMERLRSFGVLSGAPTGEHDYAKIVSSAASAVPAATGFANTTFNRSVTAPAPAASAPRMKTVSVRVGWYDRTGDASVAADERSVVLRSVIAEVAPELPASLGLPSNRSAPQRPRGRNPNIPQSAVAQADRTSTFTPSGTTATFTFDNNTGLVTQFCPVAGTCSVAISTLLSGYVQFANSTLVQASFNPQAQLSLQAELPSGTVISGVDVEVVLTQPTALTVDCVMGPAIGTSAVPYYCAVPLVAATGQVQVYTWTGKTRLTGLTLADSAGDKTATKVRVCRYTPDPTDDTPAAGNGAHPLQFVAVGRSLINQNFLVIPAGDGTVAYSCPTDDSSTPLIDGDTRRHQPE